MPAPEYSLRKMDGPAEAGNYYEALNDNTSTGTGDSVNGSLVNSNDNTEPMNDSLVNGDGNTNHMNGGLVNGNSTTKPTNDGPKPERQQAAPKANRYPYANAHYITPEQLASLKCGPKINVLIGPPGEDSGDNSVTAIEGAWANLLMYYSSVARIQLSTGTSTTISFPGTDSPTMKWIYQFMCVGQKHSEVNGTPWIFLNPSKLLRLYQQAQLIGYDFLAEKAKKRLKWVMHNRKCRNAKALYEILGAFPGLKHAVARSIIKDLTKYIISKDTRRLADVAEKVKAVRRLAYIPEALKTVPIRDFEGVVEKEMFRVKTEHWKREIRRALDKMPPDPDQPRHVSRGRPTCYVCEEFDHFAKNCPYRDNHGDGDDE
ncbi:hypothetical protein M011DRAFT_476421 [Sporormia fimetaria CBS 119925]|uniref:CCHC-type domain-containing protein n=1 Tax=Sporormia fimetaria CBS 119925 TaxID=1340428 RepID=A0A6A6VCW7_9PLEO|nr:hypothetical protein M011DRAFT_476421 [Sporormia fimetaria CBS 119925]